MGDDQSSKPAPVDLIVKLVGNEGTETIEVDMGINEVFSAPISLESLFEYVRYSLSPSNEESLLILPTNTFISIFPINQIQQIDILKRSYDE